MRIDIFQSKAYDVIENRRQEPQRSRQGADQHAVIDIVVQLDLGFASDTSYAFGHPNRIARIDVSIPPPRCQKRRWRISSNEVNWLRSGQALMRSKNFFQRSAIQRKKVVGTGKADHRAEIAACNKSHFGKPFTVKCQHRRDVGTGGMAHDDKPTRIATEFHYMIYGPAHRLGRVINKVREPDLRKDAIIGNDDCEAARRQRRPDKKIVAALAFLPASTIEEDDDRGRSMYGGLIDVEEMTRTLSIADALTRSSCSDRGDRIKKIERRRKRFHLLAAIHRSGSETHERAQKATQESMKPCVAFKSCKTDAIRFMPHDRAMIDIVARLVEIPREIPTSLIQK